MRHEMKKIGRIVDELMTLLLNEDTDEVDLNIRVDPDQAVITIIDRVTRCDDGDCRRLERILGAPRQHEIETYYWQLAGESDVGNELVLVGAMVDEAKVWLEEGDLHIRLVRRYGHPS